jgi:hypothetical protein
VNEGVCLASPENSRTEIGSWEKRFAAAERAQASKAANRRGSIEFVGTATDRRAPARASNSKAGEPRFQLPLSAEPFGSFAAQSQEADLQSPTSGREVRKGRMRKGYSDARIAASRQTASHNMGLFVDLNEIPQPHITQIIWRAAFVIADDLERLGLRHASERRAGFRAF